MLPLSQDLVISWTGMRGVVTLAAAAGIPTVTDAGGVVAERAALQVIAFVVAVGTLLIQGTTLPVLIRRLKLDHVEAIEVMDAEELAFPDNAFDVVVAQYVVTAVPDPERALDEFVRVVRPGGEIVIATRLSADAGLRDTIEKALMPITSRLGWRTEFPWARYEAWAARNGRVRLLEQRPLPPLGHFSLLRYRKLQG